MSAGKEGDEGLEMATEGAVVLGPGLPMTPRDRESRSGARDLLVVSGERSEAESATSVGRQVDSKEVGGG